MNKLLLRQSVFALILAVSATVSFADEQAKKFSQRMEAVASMVGSFEQKVFDNSGSLLQETEGSFKLKRPGYFLWEIAPPYEQLIVASPEATKVYDPDLEQLTIYQRNHLDGSPAILLSGDVSKISDQYEISAISKDGVEQYSLLPRVKESIINDFKQLDFRFSSENGTLVSLQVLDQLDQKTSIQFSSVKINANVPVSEFSPEFPPGTDIIIDEN